WENIRDLALPTITQLSGVPTSSLSGPRGRPRILPESPSKPKETLREESPTETGEYEIIMGSPDEPTAKERAPLQLPGLEAVLLELGIYVGSATLRHAVEQAAIAADSHLPVLLQGETGTGKEA